MNIRMYLIMDKSHPNILPRLLHNANATMGLRGWLKVCFFFLLLTMLVALAFFDKLQNMHTYVGPSFRFGRIPTGDNIFRKDTYLKVQSNQKEHQSEKNKTDASFAHLSQNEIPALGMQLPPPFYVSPHSYHTNEDGIGDQFPQLSAYAISQSTTPETQNDSPNEVRIDEKFPQLSAYETTTADPTPLKGPPIAGNASKNRIHVNLFD